MDTKGVTQIDVLEQHQILLVLADKTLYSYSTEALDGDEAQAAAKRPRKICHANFFKSGVCMGQQLVASVKTSALSTTIKVFEPKENMANKAKKSGFAKMLAQGQDQLKPYKEFYIPTESSSIHFLRSKLCVGCARGFEVVSLETLETQSLLDQADTSLDFVVRKENIRPIHIERMGGEFLLCYSDYSFFVNRNGWRARPDWKITWEGNPQSFAIFNPYILAFEPSFIEIRHMESGGLVHIVTAKNIRWLHSSTREVRQAPCYIEDVSLTMHRFCMLMKTSWATMLWPVWTSGRRPTDLLTTENKRCDKARSCRRSRYELGTKRCTRLLRIAREATIILWSFQAKSLCPTADDCCSERDVTDCPHCRRAGPPNKRKTGGLMQRVDGVRGPQNLGAYLLVWFLYSTHSWAWAGVNQKAQGRNRCTRWKHVRRDTMPD